MEPIRIAVVDDDPDDREFISMALSETSGSVRVHTFKSGHTFISSIGEKPVFDIVITDLRMPLMNGFELMEHLRKNEATRHLPVVVLSTSGSEIDQRKASELGCRGYYVKPYSLEGYADITSDILKKFGNRVQRH